MELAIFCLFSKEDSRNIAQFSRVFPPIRFLDRSPLGFLWSDPFFKQPLGCLGQKMPSLFKIVLLDSGIAGFDGRRRGETEGFEDRGFLGDATGEGWLAGVALDFLPPDKRDLPSSLISFSLFTPEFICGEFGIGFCDGRPNSFGGGFCDEDGKLPIVSVKFACFSF